jgi:3-hydroxyisobutyrate dehydrogenase-like beta-hydroxyacid dehydrogenase
MAVTLLEAGVEVPGWKLVPKRATRQWVNEGAALTALTEAGCSATELTELKSPAQVEKVLKKHKIAMPENLITAVSSGDTLATADDPRPASLVIGKHLANALGKIA